MPEPVPALLSPRDLKALLDSGLAPLLIHLLPAEHFAAQRLPGAACACVYEAAFPEHMARVAPDRDAHVVVYGADQLGMDAATAAGKLARLGYGQVSVLEGGIAAWREAGLPVEGTGEPRDPAWEPLPGGEFAVDPAASRLEWFGRNKNGAHHGTLRIKAGTLRRLFVLLVRPGPAAPPRVLAGWQGPDAGCRWAAVGRGPAGSLLLLVELASEEMAGAVAAECLNRGVFVRQTQGNGIRVFPALTITTEELSLGLAVLEECIAQVAAG